MYNLNLFWKFFIIWTIQLWLFINIPVHIYELHTSKYIFLESYNLWRPLLMIDLYHQTKKPINFWCRQGLNPRSLIQLGTELLLDMGQWPFPPPPPPPSRFFLFYYFYYIYNLLFLAICFNKIALCPPQQYYRYF